MTKRKRDQRIIVNTDERIVPAETEAKVEGETTIHAELPTPRQYAPPACSLCSAIREPGSNYSRVYATQRTDGSVIRYVRCHHCGNTYKTIEKI